MIVIVWAVVNWSYSTAFTNKNTQIDLLNGRLADYQEKLKGATPDQAAGEIARLRAEIDGIKHPPRDDNSIYQRGQRIGVVAGVTVDARNNLVSFARMTIGGVLDKATNIENLKILSSPFPARMRRDESRRALQSPPPTRMPNLR